MVDEGRWKRSHDIAVDAEHSVRAESIGSRWHEKGGHMPEGGASISKRPAGPAGAPEGTPDTDAAGSRGRHRTVRHKGAGPGRPRRDPRAAVPGRRTSLLVTLLLGGLTATPPLAMDMYLPALPEVTRSLHAPAATVQLTLTACLAGMAFGQLLVGPMSDRWGRRRRSWPASRCTSSPPCCARSPPPWSSSSPSGWPRASRARPPSSSPARSPATCTTAWPWPASSPPSC